MAINYNQIKKVDKKTHLKKVIFYIGFYAYKKHELAKENRTFSSAAVNIMNFLSLQLHNNFSVFILSPSWTLNSNGFYSGKKITLYNNVMLYITPSFGSVFRFGKILAKVFSQTWLLLKICSLIKKNDKVIVYHSIANSFSILLAKRFIKFTLILQLNEIYQDVQSLGKLNNYIENKIVSKADAFILSTKKLSTRIEKYNNELVVCEGVLSMNPLCKGKFDDGKIHLVYAGLIDKVKLCAYNSINLAPFLSDQYVIHIAGFGTENDIHDYLLQIERSNLQFECKIIYEGFLEGDNLINLLQQCHIGLVAQSEDKAFTNSSFPSKIYTYLSNNLLVVCLHNSLINASPVADLLYSYDVNSPSEIADLIKSIDVSTNRHSIYNERLDKINADFISRLNYMLG